MPTSDDAQDASRYRWIRRRLQIRWQEYVSGDKFPSFAVRVGCSRIDMARDPRESYLSTERFDSECEKLDAAIDAAMKS